MKFKASLIALAFVAVLFAGITPAAAQVIGDDLDGICAGATTGTADLTTCDEGEKQLCADLLPPGEPDGTDECTEDAVNVFAADGEDPIADALFAPVDELNEALIACDDAYGAGEFGPGGDGSSELAYALCYADAGYDATGAGPLVDEVDAMIVCILDAVFAYRDASDPDQDFMFSGETLTNVIMDDGAGGFTLNPEWLANENELIDTILFGCALASGPALDSVDLTTASDNGADGYFANEATQLDVAITATDAVTVSSVDFVFDPEGTPVTFYTDNAPVDVNGDGMTWTATSPAATAGDGTVRAIVNWNDGSDDKTSDSDNDVTLDNTLPTITVAYYEDDAGSPGNAITGSFINSLEHTTFHVGVTVTEANLDTDVSTITVTSPAGPETKAASTSEVFFEVTPGDAGSIVTTSDLTDWADNNDMPGATINYGPPEVAITLSSDNVKDGTAWAADLAAGADTITLTLNDLPGGGVGTPTASILDADGNLLQDGVTMAGGPAVFTLDHTVEGTEAEGPVSIIVNYNDGADQVVKSTTDESAITIDFTAPPGTVSFPYEIETGLIGYDVETGVVVDVDVGPSFDESLGAITFTVDPVDGDAVALDAMTFAVDGTADGETYSFLIDADDVSEGAALSWSIDTVEDLAGNNAGPLTGGPVDLTQLKQWVTSDITLDGETVDDLSTFIGKGDFGSLTFEASYALQVFDAADHESVSTVGLEFMHSLGNAFKVTADNPSGENDFPLVFMAQDGTVDSIEIELEDPLNADGAAYSFEFTVTNNEDGAPAATLATGDEIDFTASTLDSTYNSLAGTYATSNILADLTGPSIGGHSYAADTDGGDPGPDGKLDYIEFVAADNKLIASLTGIADNANGIGAASVEVGLLDADDVFTPLSDAMAGVLGDGQAAVDLDLATASLERGDVTFVARAVDHLGNVGTDLTEDLTLAIKQYLVVTAGEEVVWVGPDMQSVTGLFSIEPVDVVQDLKRYDFKVTDGEYSLTAFGAPGFFAGTTSSGEVRLLRHSSPDNDATLTVDANLFGLMTAAHLTQSDFEFFPLNSDGKSAPLTVVDGDYDAFTGAVFSAKLDAVVPELTFSGLTETADDNGQYQAAQGGKLTFNFEVSDADSGLATTPVRLDVYDADADEWNAYAGTTSIDTDAGTLEIARETAGRFTYRVVGIDAVGNEAYSSDIDVDIKGTATATVEGVSVSNGETELTATGGVFYLDMDSSTVDEDASTDDIATIDATILVDGAAEAGVTVEFLLDTTLLATTTTDVDGLVTFDLDPDAEGLDLDATAITVRVPAQTFSGANADLAIAEVSDDVGLLWTGFYVDVGASGALFAPGEDYIVTTSVYWLHDVMTESGIDTTGATVVSGFAGTVDLVEDMGGQTGDFEAPMDFTPTSDNPAVFDGISHGDDLQPGVAGDADAGYRRYTADLAGDLPAGLAGTATISGQDMVLVSAIQLTFESGILLGFAGEAGDFTVDAAWLHSQDYDGFTEVQTLAPIALVGAGGGDIATFDAALDGGPATGSFTFPEGASDIGVSGSSDDGPVLPLAFDIEGIVFDEALPPMGGPVSPGDNHDDGFAFAIEGSIVDGTFAGIGASLDIDEAGAAGVAQVFDPVGINDQTPFSISLDGDDIAPLGGFVSDPGIGFDFTLENPDFGVYELAINLVVAEMGDVEITVPGLSEAYREFGISHELYQISIVDTWHEDGSEAGNNMADDPASDEPIAEEDLANNEFWIDWSNELAVTQTLLVESVNWDGETSSMPTPITDGAIELSYSFDGVTWTPMDYSPDVNGEVEVMVERPTDEFGDTYGTVYYSGVVTEDGADPVAPEANVPFEPEYYYTGIQTAFTSDADVLELAGSTIERVAVATYLHDGSPVAGLQLEFDAPGGVDEAFVTTDAFGEATVSLTRLAPTAIAAPELEVDVSASNHGLADVYSSVYAGDLSWIEVANTVTVEESTDGSSWSEITESGGFYTASPGNFVRVTVNVALDDGTTEEAVDGGVAIFSGTNKDLVGGSASKTYWSSTEGQEIPVNIDLEGISHEDTLYGDFPDVFDGTLRWAS